MQTITATFEDGVLKPAEPVNLPEHAEVRLTVELIGEDEQKNRNQETLAALEALWKISRCRGGHMTREQLNERR